VNKITFGMRRNESIPDSPGPGYYDPDIADSATKTRAAAYNFGDSTGRFVSEVDG
jgi:hypothetical protein